MPGTKKKKSILLWIVVIVIAIGGFGLFRIFGPNTGSYTDEFLYIRTGSTYEDVKAALREGHFINDMWSFDLLAQRVKYPAKVKAGKYRISHGMSNYNIIRMLRSGRQTPVKLVINKLRTKQDFIHFVSMNLEADSQQMKQLFADNTYLSQFGLDTNTAMCAVIPDTYEFFWNTNADKTFRKIAKYYTAYWNDARKQKASAKGLTQQQAIIIASIVDEETNKNDEKGNIASVYMNRLKTGMKLQADPTIKFAIGDFAIRRVTGAMMEDPSPYNTYVHMGLPPGPICTPSKKSIEAVLDAPETKYIYFCAKEDFTGYHRFATNYADHLKNAQLYQQALNARNIH